MNSKRKVDTNIMFVLIAWKINILKKSAPWISSEIEGAKRLTPITDHLPPSRLAKGGKGGIFGQKKTRCECKEEATKTVTNHFAAPTSNKSYQVHTRYWSILTIESNQTKSAAIHTLPHGTNLKQQTQDSYNNATAIPYVNDITPKVPQVSYVLQLTILSGSGRERPKALLREIIP